MISSASDGQKKKENFFSAKSFSIYCILTIPDICQSLAGHKGYKGVQNIVPALVELTSFFCLVGTGDLSKPGPCTC